MSDDHIPSIGDNAPTPPAPLEPDQIHAFLEYALASLLSRRSEMVAALQDTIAAHPRIDDDDTLGDVAENLRMAKALVRTADDRRTEHKRPFLEGGRAVDDWFRTFGDPIMPLMDQVGAVMLEYSNRVEAKRKAEAEERARIAAREAQMHEDAARRAAEAARAREPDVLFPDDPEAINRAAEAEAARQRADRARAAADAKPAARTRVRGAYGAVASVRSTWDYEITDKDAVPEAFKVVDPQLVRQWMARNRRPNGKPDADVPGLAWVEKRSMGVR